MAQAWGSGDPSLPATLERASRRTRSSRSGGQPRSHPSASPRIDAERRLLYMPSALRWKPRGQRGQGAAVAEIGLNRRLQSPLTNEDLAIASRHLHRLTVELFRQG